MPFGEEVIIKVKHPVTWYDSGGTSQLKLLGHYVNVKIDESDVWHVSITRERYGAAPETITAPTRSEAKAIGVRLLKNALKGPQKLKEYEVE